MIRIIGGEHKGKRISAPSNLPVRPTTDYAKEGLFNLLNNRIDLTRTKALDLFSGTGNITYELASRGCPDIVSVDSDFHCVRFIAETAKKLDMPQVKVTKMDAYVFIRKKFAQWDLIFADAPFDQKESSTLPGLIFENGILAPGGLLIIEHSARTVFADTSHLKEQRSYGKVIFSIFSS
ncbi:MAG TPA: RsmD family RNA methyltransferase [Bacteroidia bacterium]|jgi:16S rRNA (guanine(966)-N(2))-methyltransferase RsmD|nr:RsmD family RNA methyltransferase [Bacteroidia bacterium]